MKIIGAFGNHMASTQALNKIHRIYGFVGGHKIRKSHKSCSLLRRPYRFRWHYALLLAAFILLCLWALSLVANRLHKNRSPLPALATPITDAPLVDTLAFPDVGGQLIFDAPNGKLWRLPLKVSEDPAAESTPDKRERLPLFRIAPGTFAFQPAIAPDNTLVAYGFSRRY